MAVTKHLVRLPQAQLERMSVDTSIAEQLLSFQLTPPDDHLDLDWASTGLMKLVATATAGVCEAFTMVIQGVRTVVHESAMEELYSDIRCVDSADVKRAAQVLSVSDATAFGDAIPDDLEALRQVLQSRELPNDAERYYRKHYNAVVAFVQQAAARDLAMVMWWE